MSWSLKRLCTLLALLCLMSGCGAVKFSAKNAAEDVPPNVEPGSTPTSTPPGDGGGGGNPTPTPTPTPTSTPPGGGGGGGNPTPTPTPPGGDNPRRVTYSNVVPPSSNNVDILLIIDDSGSMEADQKKLASRLSTFASMLENQAALPIDWQMCVTVTRAQSIAGRTGTFWGASINWVSYTPPPGTPQYILKKGATNLNTIFKNTIDAIGSGVANSTDERGIKAAHRHFYNGDPNAGDGSGCYRKGASVAVVLISDEDERSVGGDASRVKRYAPLYEDPSSYQPLEKEDLPKTLLEQAQTIFGNNVRFTFNSIVVSTKACEDTQDAEKDSRGQHGASHMGTKYIEMSNLTNGGVGSICDADYSSNLNLFKNKISNSLSSLTLECAPVANTLVVKVDGVQTTAYTLTGANLKFNNAIVEGRLVDLVYYCN